MFERTQRTWTAGLRQWPWRAVRYQPWTTLTVRVENADNNTDSVAVSFECPDKERDVMLVAKINLSAGVEERQGATKSWWTTLATPANP